MRRGDLHCSILAVMCVWARDAGLWALKSIVYPDSLRGCQFLQEPLLQRNGRTRKKMQSANAAAPRILEALATLGECDMHHVRFAMLGLNPNVQAAAMQAVEAAKPVAACLRSRKIATSLRIETAALQRKSADVITNVARWDSPGDFMGGEFVPILLELLMRGMVTDFATNTADYSEHLRLTSDGLDRRYKVPLERVPTLTCQEHFAIVAPLAQINRAWRETLGAWFYEGIDRVALIDPTDAHLRGVAWLCPNLRQLECHPRFTTIYGSEAMETMALTAGALAPLVESCDKLERVLVRHAPDAVKGAALIQLMERCPLLCELDLIGSFPPSPQGVALQQQLASLTPFVQAMALHPRVRVTVAGCDVLNHFPLATERQRDANGSSPSSRHRCVTCFYGCDTVEYCTVCWDYSAEGDAEPLLPLAWYGCASWVDVS